jgi:stage II sporulation protein D
MPSRHLSHRSVLPAVLAATALVLSGTPAHAARAPRVIETLRVPDHATLRVTGHGYGHGHGLSQYGAEGAARKGLSAQRIVRFYYPHTHAGTFHGRVRVLISEDTDQNTTVVNRAGLKVRDLGTGRTWTLPRTGRAGKASRWRLASRHGKPARLAYHTGHWHLWRRLSGDGEFRASGPIRVVLPGGARAYRGTLQSRTSTRGGSKPHRITVNKVSMESYVRAVVPSEAFPSWHQAALRAQAIAARSYAAYGVDHPLSRLYQICDTTACQVYGGVAAEYPTTDRATAKTAGQIRIYHGRAAFTQFSASNGGWTAAGGKPYLPAQRDPYDGWSGNPYHSWTTNLSARRIERAWPALGNLTSIAVDRRDGHGQWHGRILTMTLHGSKGDVRITGDDFRARLGLRSTWFDLATA